MTASLLSVPDTSGHTEIKWDPNIPAEVENARAAFTRMKGEHKYLAYRVNADRSRDLLREFDPAATEIVMMPQTQGG